MCTLAGEYQPGHLVASVRWRYDIKSLWYTRRFWELIMFCRLSCISFVWLALRIKQFYFTAVADQVLWRVDSSWMPFDKQQQSSNRTELSHHWRTPHG